MFFAPISFICLAVMIEMLAGAAPNFLSIRLAETTISSRAIIPAPSSVALTHLFERKLIRQVITGSYAF